MEGIITIRKNSQPGGELCCVYGEGAKVTGIKYLVLFFNSLTKKYY
jgi:hypothetical protein